MEILKLEHICYQYEKTNKEVLHDFSYTFESGKLYCIMGASGAGKSTLLSLIAGLDLPSSGQILYESENIAEINRDTYRAQKIGVIFQSYNLLLNATAAENIRLSMDISGKNPKSNPQMVYDLLVGVGIDNEKADRKVLKLSGGEQQRVAIARAVANGSPVLIADEPTGNLDSDNEEKIMDIFYHIAHEENKCVIIVTHSQRVAETSDVVIKLKEKI